MYFVGKVVKRNNPFRVKCLFGNNSTRLSRQDHKKSENVVVIF